MTTTDEPIYQVESLIAEDIDAYLDAHQHKTMLRFITCGSVDDGKSTLIGRMLYDSHMIFEDHLQALESDSKRVGTQGEAIDFALLVDGLAAEREQGITSLLFDHLGVLEERHDQPLQLLFALDSDPLSKVCSQGVVIMLQSIGREDWHTACVQSSFQFMYD